MSKVHKRHREIGLEDMPMLVINNIINCLFLVDSVQLLSISSYFRNLSKITFNQNISGEQIPYIVRNSILLTSIIIEDLADYTEALSYLISNGSRLKKLDLDATYLNRIQIQQIIDNTPSLTSLTISTGEIKKQFTLSLKTLRSLKVLNLQNILFLDDIPSEITHLSYKLDSSQYSFLSNFTHLEEIEIEISKKHDEIYNEIVCLVNNCKKSLKRFSYWGGNKFPSKILKVFEECDLESLEILNHVETDYSALSSLVRAKPGLNYIYKAERELRPDITCWLLLNDPKTTQFYFNCNESKHFNLIKTLKEERPYLTDIIIYNPSDILSTVSHLLRLCPNVKKVVLYINCETDILEYFPPLIHLETLIIKEGYCCKSVFSIEKLTLFPSLKHLEVESYKVIYYEIEKTMVLTTVTTFPNIVMLYINQLHDKIPSLFPNLEEISFVIHDDQIADYIGRLPKLSVVILPWQIFRMRDPYEELKVKFPHIHFKNEM